ncbi:MAG: hypothetical protein H6741_11795 [Alphaproteobacteria bacterium]|nr:hypothetical protein [Alphaproteobacteria bacterium]MCB9793394.1 hypothetical protein [Alphaproteobacteria bacterium]
MSAPSPTRALPLRWLALAAVVALGGLELGVRALYSPPAPMLRKALAYQEAPHAREELIILGTCLPEQIIHPDELAKQLPDVDVHVLASPAATIRLFYLFLDNFLDGDEQIRAILVPYGRRDLTNLMAPWESQVMELAGWEDLPQLAEWACPGELECALEMGLRKASWTYRYRGYLANRFWYGLRTRPPIPGWVLSPGAVDPKDSPEAAAPGGLQGQQGPGDHAGPGAPPPQKGGAALGWERPEAELAEADPRRFVYLEALLDAARARGIRVVFTPLPERAAFSPGGAHRNPEYEQRVAKTIQEGGGELLDLEKVPGLDGRHFEDDVHLNPEGQRLVTRAIGQALSEQL